MHPQKSHFKKIKILNCKEKLFNNELKLSNTELIFLIYFSFNCPVFNANEPKKTVELID